jgi:hypothetical protein
VQNVRCRKTRWQHIYLPLLPRSFADYLTAPMPFLVGLHAAMLPALKGIEMEHVTMVDLDLGGWGLGRMFPWPG